MGIVGCRLDGRYSRLVTASLQRANRKAVGAVPGPAGVLLCIGPVTAQQDDLQPDDGSKEIVSRGNVARILAPSQFVSRSATLLSERRAPRPSMNKRLCLFAASFLLSVPSAPMASANLVCIEGAAGGCTRWSNGHSCLRGTGLGCSRWSNGLTCAQGGETACVEWSNGVFCLRGVGHHCSRWSNGSQCVSQRGRECVEWTGDGFF